MKLDFPVFAVSLVVVASLQELLPGLDFWGRSGAKVQLLPILALYYLYHREWPVALSMALMAGILTDVLGMLPFGTTSFALLFFGLGVLTLRDVKAPYSPYHLVIPSVILSFAVGLIQVIVFSFSEGRLFGMGFFSAFFATLKVFPFTILASILIEMAMCRIERCTGSLETRKEVQSL